MNKRLLTGLEQTLQLDVRFYGGTFLRMSLSHVSTIIRGLATSYLLSRWLLPETLGQFRYILAFFGMASVFAMSGMSSAVIRGVAKGDTIVAHVAFRRMLRWTPLGTLALFIAAIVLWVGSEQDVAMGLAVAALAFVPSSVGGLYGPILIGQEQIARLTRITVVNNLLYALVFLVTLWLNQSLMVIVAAYFGFDILFRGFLTWRELRRLPIRGSVAEHLSLGNHLTVIGIFQSIASYLDQVLIQRFVGYSALASYSIIIMIPELLKDFANGITGTVLQRLSRHEKTEAHVRATRRHFWLATAGSAGMVAMYAVISPFALPLLFPQYPDIVIPSIVYAVGLLSLSCTVGVYFFQAHHELKRLWRFYIVTTVVQYAANIVLIPLFGLWGAVWSKTATRFSGMPFAYPLMDSPKHAKQQDGEPAPERS